LQIVEAVADRCNDFEDRGSYRSAQPIQPADQPPGGLTVQKTQVAEIEF
jgi:hypothetical protein